MRRSRPPERPTASVTCKTRTGTLVGFGHRPQRASTPSPSRPWSLAPQHHTGAVGPSHARETPLDRQLARIVDVPTRIGVGWRAGVPGRPWPSSVPKQTTCCFDFESPASPGGTRTIRARLEAACHDLHDVGEAPHGRELAAAREAPVPELPVEVAPGAGDVPVRQKDAVVVASEGQRRHVLDRQPRRPRVLHAVADASPAPVPVLPLRAGPERCGDEAARLCRLADGEDRSAGGAQRRSLLWATRQRRREQRDRARDRREAPEVPGRRHRSTEHGARSITPRDGTGRRAPPAGPGSRG